MTIAGYGGVDRGSPPRTGRTWWRRSLTAGLLMLSLPALAQDDAVRDGMPCLSGICIGDELSTLADVEWLEARSTRPAPGLSSLRLTKEYDPSPLAVRKVLKMFPDGASPPPEELMPYLAHGTFDSTVLAEIAELEGFCEPWDSLYPLEGQFESASGHVTIVGVNVRAGENPEDQALRVSRITRKYEGEYTAEQRRDLVDQIDQRYAGIPEHGNEFPNVKFDGSTLRLWESADTWQNAPERVKRYPGCLSGELLID